MKQFLTKRIYELVNCLLGLCFVSFSGSSSPMHVYSFPTNSIFQLLNTLAIDQNSGVVYVSDTTGNKVYSLTDTGTNPILLCNAVKPLGIHVAKKPNGAPNIWIMAFKDASPPYMLGTQNLSGGTISFPYEDEIYDAPQNIVASLDGGNTKSIFITTPAPALNSNGQIKVFDAENEIPGVSIPLNSNEFATGLDYRGDYLYAAIRDNTIQGKVSVINPINLQAFDLPNPNGKLKRPFGIATISSSSIYAPLLIIDRTRQNIQYYENNGINVGNYDLKSELPDGTFNLPISIALNETLGKIYVLDEGGQKNLHIYLSSKAWTKDGISNVQQVRIDQPFPLTLGKKLMSSKIPGTVSPFTPSTGFITLAAGSNLQLQGGEFAPYKLIFDGGLISASTNSIVDTTQTVDITANNGTIDVDEDIILQILTPIVKTGTNLGKLIKQGLGELRLTKFYNGSMDIKSGIVSVSEGNNIGEINTNVDKITLGTNASSATLKFLPSVNNIGVFHEIVLNTGGGIFNVYAGSGAAPSKISGNGSLTKIGLGTLFTATPMEYLGGTFINQGKIYIGADNVLPIGGDVFIDMDGTLDLSIYSQTIKNLTGTGLITSDSGDPDSTAILILMPDVNSIFSGNIQDGTGKVAVTLNSPGVTQTFSGNNSYSGGTVVQDITLKLGSAGALPQGRDVTISANGTLDLNGKNPTIGSLNGQGTVTNTSANSNSTLTLQPTADSIFSGTISDNVNNNGVVSVVINSLNNFIQTFSGNNAHSGGTRVQAGTIIASNNSALGTGEVSLEGGTLQAGQDPLTLDNDISLGAFSTIDNNGYALTFSGDFLSPIEGVLEFTDSSLAQNGTTILSGQSTFTDKLITLSTQLTNSGVMTLESTTILENNHQFTNTGKITINASTISNRKTIINTGEIINNERFLNFDLLRLDANSKFTGTGTVSLSGSTMLFNGPGIEFNNNIALNPDFVDHIGVTLSVVQGVTQSINNVISSPNGPVTLTKDGIGTLALNGANTLQGEIILSEGVLQVGHNSALGDSTLRMLNNTVLKFGDNNLALGNSIQLDSGNSVNPAVATIDTGNFMSALSNAITQIGNSVMKLIIQGGNVLTLNGLISHEGSTEIGLGTTLKTGNANIFAGVNKSLKLAGAGSTFDMTAADQTLGELQSSISTSQVLLNNRTLTINQPSTFDGVFSGVGGSIIAKADLTLGGQSTNTGLFTIDASVNPVTMTMKVNSSLAAGSSLSLIGSGANNAVFDMQLASQTISELNGNAHSLIELGNQKLTFGTNNNSIFKGEIQGTNFSALVKKGNGIANFEGISPNFHGTTSVVTGRLVLKNPLPIGTGVLEIETPDSPSIGNSGFVDLDFSGQANQHEPFSNSVKGTGELNVAGTYIDITGDNSNFVGSLHIGGSAYVTEQQNLGQSTVNLTGSLSVTPQGDFTFSNRLIASSTGTLNVFMATPQNVFQFGDITHGFLLQFEGEVDLEQGAFDITGLNTEALNSATLKLSGNGIAYLGGNPANPLNQTIKGLTFAGGRLSLTPSVQDIILPADTLTVDTLDLTSPLGGSVQITIPNDFDPPEDWDGHNKPLLMQDDGILTQLIKANHVNGNGLLSLVDQNGDIINAQRETDIEEGAQVVAKGYYDYGILTQNDGLYLNYALQRLALENNQTTVLAGDHQGQGASEFHAKLTGPGNIEIDATDSITLNNIANDFTGTTTVKSGKLILGSDHSLGETSDLILKPNTQTNLFGTTQTIGALHSEANSLLQFSGGHLAVEQGGGVESETLSGLGSLTVENNVLQVNGSNSAFGATTIIDNGAEVRLSDPHGLGTSLIENNGRLSLQGHANIIDNLFINSITGIGIFSIDDADVKLRGNNQHTGGTEIKDSIVSVISDSNLGAAAAEVKLDDSTLTFDSSVTLSQTRTLTLSNNTVFDTQNYSTEINGPINGGGVLTKQNVGKLTFTGDKNFNGTINVDAGELKVNGDMVNTTVNVENGATFSGNNTVLSLINRGIVAPGNSIGQIQVRNIFNNTGGVYQCEVNDAGQSDLIRVIGAASITTLHGTLQVIPMAGNYQLNQPYIYTILTSANPINTTFDTVNGVSPLFAYNVIYNPNNVQLRMIRTSTLNQVITEGNAGIVSQNLEKIGNLTGTLQTAINSLMGFNKSQIIDALNRFNTASNTLLADNLADNFFDLGNTLSHMLHSPLERSAAHSSFKELVKSVSSNFKATMAQLFSSSAKRSSMNQTTRSNGQQIPHSFRSKIGQSTVWSHSDAKVLNQKSYTSPGTYLPALKSTMGETKLGFDHQFTDQILVGFMAGYGNTSYKLSDHYGDGKINSYHLGSYSSIHITPEFYVDTLVSYGMNNLKGTRKINFSGFEAEASQKHHAHHFGGMIDTGYEIYLPSNFSITPMAGIGILSLKEEGYREIGADTLGLNVRRQRRTYIQHKFGAQLAKHFMLDEMQFYGFIRGAYTYRKGLKNAHRVTSSFIGQLPSFTVFGDKKNHSFFSPGAGLTALFKNDVYISIGYNGDLGKKQKSHEGFFKIGYKF